MADGSSAAIEGEERLGPEGMSIGNPLLEAGLVEVVSEGVMCENAIVMAGIRGGGSFSNRCSGWPSIKWSLPRLNKVSSITRIAAFCEVKVVQ